MRVTPPVEITTARLISSSATDIHNPPAYVAGTTYAYGEIVSVATDYKIYESLSAGNIGHTPSENPSWWKILGPTETAYDPAKIDYALGETCSFNHRCYESLVLQTAANPLPVFPEKQTAFWYDVGPTNKWAMFDLSSNTQTVVPSTMTFVIAPGERVNTVGLSGMKGNTLQVSATSVTGGGAVYPNANSASSTGIFDLNTRIVRDGYDYAFEPFSTTESNVIFDIPPFSDIIITVTITATSGNVKLGSCVTGTYIYLGKVQYHAKADSLNFSTVTRDLYGGATLVPRAAFPKTTQTLHLPSNRVNKAMAAKTILDAKPALWTGLDDSTSDWFEMLQILGIWKEFAFNGINPTTVEITLNLEEI